MSNEEEDVLRSKDLEKERETYVVQAEKTWYKQTFPCDVIC